MCDKHSFEILLIQHGLGHLCCTCFSHMIVIINHVFRESIVEPTMRNLFLCYVFMDIYIVRTSQKFASFQWFFWPSGYFPMTRLFMEEIQEYLEGSSKHYDKDGSWKEFVHLLPLPFNQMGFQVQSWKKLYSRDVLNASLAKIQIAGFSQSIVSLQKPSYYWINHKRWIY